MATGGLLAVFFHATQQTKPPSPQYSRLNPHKTGKNGLNSHIGYVCIVRSTRERAQAKFGENDRTKDRQREKDTLDHMVETL